MATQQSQQNADWRARQKERERERRRMRDRQRRQSMSIEEREKHLARRRRNYQLRRQRAATAQLGFGQTHTSSVGSLIQSDNLSENLAIMCVSDVKVQSDSAMLYENENENEEEALVMNNIKDGGNVGETRFQGTFKYPRLPRLNHIRKLARCLNASVDYKMTSVDAADSNLVVNPTSVLGGSRIRLVHVKHLARALNSNVGKNARHENVVVRMNDDDDDDEATSECADVK